MGVCHGVTSASPDETPAGSSGSVDLVEAQQPPALDHVPATGTDDAAGDRDAHGGDAEHAGDHEEDPPLA